MRIESINLRNFRGIRDLSLGNLDKNVNLFVGVNGVGKSSILDAIYLVFSWYTARMLSATGRGNSISKYDVSHHTSDCYVELEVSGGGRWKLYKGLHSRKDDESDLSQLNSTVSTTREQQKFDKAMSVPVFAYYGVNRAISGVCPRMPNADREYIPSSVYKYPRVGAELFSSFFAWFRYWEDIENESFRDYNPMKNRSLDAVRAAMTSVFPDYGEMRVSRRPLSLQLRKGDEAFRIDQLSDGEKCYIMLVCDIARRLATANPKLSNPLEGEGIVLIDEVDLHLHPKWQQTVVSSLVKTFPNCQFFITTHSPIVASDTKSAVFYINGGEVYKKQTYGKLSSGILSSVFDIAEARSLYVLSLFKEAYDDIANGNDEAYNRKLKELIAILGADDLDVIGLQIEKRRRGKNENN